ncbi:MAG TPA: SCO family protein [Burkholderiaceae bacterium]|nr:SCO family protein [Burkholderiaceae bacterium]
MERESRAGQAQIARDRRSLRLVVALSLVCAIGLGAIGVATDGYAVVTTEAARRLSIAAHPRSLPDVALANGSAVGGSLHGLLRQDGRVAIVDFIYTRCFSLCLAMGSEFQQLQDTIERRGLADRVRLISISFDPADTPDDLARYARDLHADPTVWRFYGAPTRAGLEILLRAFGVVVVPAPLGQFVHNAAYHVITPDGRLTRVVDYGASGEALRFAAGEAAQRVLERAPVRTESKQGWGVPARPAQGGVKP